VNRSPSQFTVTVVLQPVLAVMVIVYTPLYTYSGRVEYSLSDLVGGLNEVLRGLGA